MPRHDSTSPGAFSRRVAPFAPLGLALLMSNAALPPRTASVRTSAPKEFSIPLSNLREWARTVVVTINDVRIDGHSPVHNLEADCEMHLGAHSSAFSGDPDGLVLEPMNACIQPFPGKAEQSNADWTEFGDKIKGSTVIASGVPRIWPEHL